MINKEKYTAAFNRVTKWVINISFYTCMAFLAWTVMQVFVVTSFKIPSDSMSPALQTGDKILVEKLSMGARLFNVFAALRNEDIEIYRVPGIKSLERNDVVVFNFPYEEGKDSIRFDVMQYFVKRCIALPGDTLEVRKGYFHIPGVDGRLGNIDAQEDIAGLTDSIAKARRIVFGCFPWDGRINWTIRDFGPLPVPAKGQVVKLDARTAVLYKRLIRWEQKQRLTMRGDTILLGDSIISEYRFTRNYYFVSGDKMQNSQDSRYWGMLPEEYIVGRAFLIWKSDDPLTGDIRWDRILKKIK